MTEWLKRVVMMTNLGHMAMAYFLHIFHFYFLVQYMIKSQVSPNLYHLPFSISFKSIVPLTACVSMSLFLKSAWRHGVIDYYDKARSTPYFAPWHFGDRLGVYRWPQCKYRRGFYKSHSRLSKITAGNRCRNIWTMQNMTNRSLIDSNKLGTWS